jgi:hypothetical protein
LGLVCGGVGHERSVRKRRGFLQKETKRTTRIFTNHGDADETRIRN